MFPRAARLLVAPVVLLAGVRCAHVEAPSGGPVDTIPPRVAAVYPAPDAVSVPADARIILQFTEWIHRGAARGTVAISPPYAGRTQVEVDGDRLIIKPPAGRTLRPRTTHTVTVLGSLQDLRTNPMGDVFTLRFSTGPFLDSAGFDGSLSREGRRGPLLVALYHTTDRAVSVDALSPRDTGFTVADAPEPWRELPAAIAGADSTGRFVLEGAAPGDYAVFAFEDVNGNFTFDVGLEAAAPGEPTLALRPRAATQSLRLTPLDTLPLRILEVVHVPDSGGTEEFPVGALHVRFGRPPHPARAAESTRYLVLPDSGDAVSVTGAEWNPQRDLWVLTTPPLRAGMPHRLVMRTRPDFPGRHRVDEPDTSAPFDVGTPAPAPASDTTNGANEANAANAPAWTLTTLTAGDDGTGLPRATSAPEPSRLSQSSQSSGMPQGPGQAAGTARQLFASSRILTPERWDALATRLETRIRRPGDTLFLVAPHGLHRLGPTGFMVTWDAPPRPGDALEVRLRPAADDTSAPRVLYTGTVPDTAQARRLKVAAPAERADWIFWAQSAAPATGTVVRHPLRAQGDSLVSAPLPRGRYVVQGFHDRDRDRVWDPGSIRPWIPQETHEAWPDTVDLSRE